MTKGRMESYQYDQNGNPTQFTDRRGVVTSYRYDALNRLAQSSFGGQSSIGITYDAGGRITQAVDSVTGTISRAYDGLDRQTAEVTPQGSVSYNYDAATRRISMGVSGHAWVHKASAGWRAAYSELMAKYPNESPANKDAFFKVSVEGGSR
jgi:YD repeat-containing protein